MTNPTKEYALKVFDLLKSHYPNAKMILNWENNFELLVAIILSAQCTDKKVNEVTLKLFPKYKTRKKEFEDKYQKYLRTSALEKKGSLDKSRDDKLDKEMIIQLVNFAFVGLHELEKDIYATGFYHNKAKNIQEAAKVVLEKYQGVLPRSLDELVKIPGVGRKTANVFLGNAYHIVEGIAVDTHVSKQSQILGLTKNKNPEKIEKDLMSLFPKDKWFTLTYLLIEHGRNMRRKQSDRILCNNLSCILCYPKDK